MRVHFRSKTMGSLTCFHSCNARRIENQNECCRVGSNSNLRAGPNDLTGSVTFKQYKTMNNKTTDYIKLELAILSCKTRFIARRQFICLPCNVYVTKIMACALTQIHFRDNTFVSYRSFARSQSFTVESL
jgi:hypothetical protein